MPGGWERQRLPGRTLGRVLDAPAIFLGTGLPEDHWHANDQSIDMEMLLSGAATIADLWNELGELPLERVRKRR